MALCGNPARSDALAVAPRALRACACGAVRIFATWASFCVAGCGDRACCERVRGPRAHFCDLGIVLRGRLRGSGVLRACAWASCAFLRPGHRFAWQAVGIGRVGGVPRVCRGAVPWGLGSGRVLYTHGQRAFRVAGCGDRACWEVGRGHACGHAAGALPWGLGSGRVAHAQDFTRCDLRFAWQVWDFGCIDALGKALDGGSAWQAQ